MKPQISLPTLLTYMLSSRGCSHGDELVHRSTGCRNWAITLRHLNTFHYFPHTHVSDGPARTIDRNINCDTTGDLFANILHLFSSKSPHASHYSVAFLFTNRKPTGSHLEQGPPPADLREAVSCFL